VRTAGASSASERSRARRESLGWRLQISTLALLVLFPAVPRADLEPPPPGRDASELLAQSGALFQSRGTYIVGTMTIMRPEYTEARNLGLRVWTDRSGDRSFLRILSPASHAGTGFLEVQPNLWKFVPSVERLRRVPDSALGEDWMGSDWQIRDLFPDPRRLDHYEHAVLGIDDAPPGHPGLRAYRIESIAKVASPAPWARILEWVEVEHGTPLQREFYNAEGRHRKTLRMSGIRAVQGRRVPHSWSMVPYGKKGKKKGRGSILAIDEIRFDQSFAEEIFTTRQLRSWP
jgi:hypothetical protein